jgi:hypothetical protein
LAGIVVGWSLFNIVSDSAALHSLWLLLPRIEISWSFMTIFNSILHVVSENKIIKNFSQSEAFMAPDSHVG